MIRSNLHEKLTAWDNFVGGNNGGDSDDTQILDAMIDNSITDVNSNAKNVRRYKFQNCDSLVKATFPTATTIGEYAFNGCTSLVEVNFPTATRIDQYAFNGCTSLVGVNFPNVTVIWEYAFSGCTQLTTADLSNVTTIGEYAFSGCTQLTTLIIRTETLCGLLSSLSRTPITSGTGYIYVPSALVDSYKSAENWSTYANQIRALEDYTVDGTVDGELDESKI